MDAAADQVLVVVQPAAGGGTAGGVVTGHRENHGFYHAQVKHRVVRVRRERVRQMAGTTKQFVQSAQGQVYRALTEALRVRAGELGFLLWDGDVTLTEQLPGLVQDRQGLLLSPEV